MTAITARIVPIVTTVLLTATAASANTASFVPVPIPAGTAVTAGSSGATGTLDGFASFDLTLNTTSDWQAAALLITLTRGQIFQEAEGGLGKIGVTLGQPDPAGFAFYPSSEFDSRIFDPHGGATIAGAGGDVGGDVQQFDSSEIDISWNSASADTADIGTFSIGRFTWSNDAQGTVDFAFAVAGLDRIDFSFIIIPEPTSLTLLSLGGLGLLRRRRDRCGGEI